jgi:hypothetical protein
MSFGGGIFDVLFCLGCCGGNNRKIGWLRAILRHDESLVRIAPQDQRTHPVSHDPGGCGTH